MGKPCNMQFLDSIQSTLDFVNGDPEFLGWVKMIYNGVGDMTGSSEVDAHSSTQRDINKSLTICDNFYIPITFLLVSLTKFDFAFWQLIIANFKVAGSGDNRQRYSATMHKFEFYFPRNQDLGGGRNKEWDKKTGQAWPPPVNKAPILSDFKSPLIIK